MSRFAQSDLSRPVQNRLLLALPPAELDRLLPRLDRVAMPIKMQLVPSDHAVESMHFVETGTVSMITTMDDGVRIEVGLVGSEGVVGLPLILGSGLSAIEGMVQVEGVSLRLSAANYRAALTEMPSLLGLLLHFVDSFYAQVTQAAACNARHQIEQRLARWILMTQDRVVGDSFPMTQEFMSTMLGVRRPGVTIAIGALQRAGLLLHERGVVRVINRAGLEAAACECYEIVARRYAWLVPPKSEFD